MTSVTLPHPLSAKSALSVDDYMGFNPDQNERGPVVNDDPTTFNRDDVHTSRQVSEGASETPAPLGNVKVRVRGTVRVMSKLWVQVDLQLRLDGDSPWLELTPKGVPLLVARQFSGKDGKREARELYVIAAMRRQLALGGATVMELAGSECRDGSNGQTEWRYWALLAGGLSVALEMAGDGSVKVLNLR